MEKAKPTISSLGADEVRVLKELKCTIQCKNTKQTHHYNFGGRPQFESMRRIISIFAWAIYKRRHHAGHQTRVSARDYFWNFLRFLDEQGIREPEELVKGTLLLFVHWLKQHPSLSYSTASAQFRGLRPFFIQMSKHEKVSCEFVPPKNAFPKASSLQSASLGYDKKELKDIVRAAVAGMRETMEKFNSEYIPQWLGKPPPIDDVAPFGPNGGGTYWSSLEYKIWWWENHCKCVRLNSTDLSRMPQEQVFMSSFKTENQTGMVGVERFYDAIGAGPKYVTKYLGQSCPITYRTPWKKIDYLVWYWENNLGCKPLWGEELKEVSPEFFGALKEYFGGRVNEFYGALGIYRWLSGSDLVSFYILLLIRTQLNPSVVQRLTVDCIIPDPLNPDKKRLSWIKYRSSKEGSTIQSDQACEGWPVMIVNKILKITESIRGDETELWITNSNRFKTTLPLGNSGFKDAMKEFSLKHHLKHSSGEPLILQAKLIRPTMAWSEYLRTEDMRYLQTLLGQEKLETTADYLRRISDPLFIIRRGVHQEAWFLDLIATDGSGISSSASLTSGLLSSCKDPLRSPIPGQSDGKMCDAGHEVCLGCSNLVITHEDIKKYFCFMRYHDELYGSGLISFEEHCSATAEKKFVWENQILTRYPVSVINEIRRDADLRPIGIWSPTVEGMWL